MILSLTGTHAHTPNTIFVLLYVNDLLNNFSHSLSLSDDELTPYDMSSDQVKQKVTPPRYVRDCLDGETPLSII